MKAIIAGLLVAASGCATDEVAPVDQSSGHAGPAYLEVHLTDTSDALAQWQGAQPKLLVDIAKVEIQHTGGQWITISSGPREVDLMAVEDGNMAVVSTSLLPHGAYSAVRVTVDSATLIVPDQAPQAIAVRGEPADIALSTELADTTEYALALDFNTADSMLSTNAPSLAPSLPQQPLAFGAMVPAISLLSMSRM